MGPKPVPVPATPSDDPAAAEEKEVHEVYEAIAPHFARTRFKPWPLIERFLATLPAGALGLDAGAGNGKYLPAAAAAGAWAIALDRSKGLLDIARGQLADTAECVRGDLCDVPWRSGLFDFAISVAAIHHLSTPDRRADGVRALLRPLRLAPGEPSRFFIYVWAYEQGPLSRRKMGSLADANAAAAAAAAAGQGEGGGGGGSGGSSEAVAPVDKVQDVMVPWILAPQAPKASKPKEPRASRKTRVKGTRHPHAQAQEQQERQEAEQQEQQPDSEPIPATTAPAPEPEPEPQVFNRYYHLFVEGELRALVERAALQDGFVLRATGDDDDITPSPQEGHKWLRVVAEGWEADNWWIEGEVGV